MSVHVQSPVWLVQMPTSAWKCVALKLADCANDDGESIYPSVARIARETDADEATVRRALAAFGEAGLIEVVAEAHGNRRFRSTTVRKIDLLLLNLLAAVDNRDGTFTPPTHILKQIDDGEVRVIERGKRKGETVPVKRWVIVLRALDDVSIYDQLAPSGWVHPAAEIEEDSEADLDSEAGSTPRTMRAVGCRTPRMVRGVPLAPCDPTPRTMRPHPSHGATQTIIEPSIEHTHTEGVSATDVSVDATNVMVDRTSVGESSYVEEWQSRVFDNFIEPLTQSLQIRDQHRSAMNAMVTDFAKFSSKVLYQAAREIRASRSVFPTIAQAMPVLEAVHKREFKATLMTVAHPDLPTWRDHLAKLGDKKDVAKIDRMQPFNEFVQASQWRDQVSVDANLLDDVKSILDSMTDHHREEVPA